MAKEALRVKIDGERQINRITELLGADWEQSKVPEYRAKMDGHFKLLGKVLPDLRAVEYSNIDTDKPPEELTDAEIADRLAELDRARRELAKGAAKEKPSPSEPPEIH